MRCAHARDLILDQTVGHLAADEQAALAAHLLGCHACRAWRDEQRELTAGLGKVAAAACTATPPEGLEERLLEAFDTRRPAAGSQPRWHLAVALPVAAAAIVLLAGVVWWLARDHSGAAGTEPGAATEARTAESAPALVSGLAFIPLPGAAMLPAFESGAIVRVEIAPAMLPLYGIDLPPDLRNAPVAADLLVGQDGWPRAIRLAGSRP